MTDKDNNIEENFNNIPLSKVKVLNKLKQESIKNYSTNLYVFKDGKNLLSVNHKNYTGNLIHVYSITKSFLSIAIHFLIQDKLLKSSDEYVCNYIDEWKNDNRNKIKIKHLLTHQSGLSKKWDFFKFMYPDGDYNLLGKKKGPNSYDISINIKKTHKIESEWYYNNIACQCLVLVINKISKSNISDYLNKKLFKPLNIKYKWNQDDYGNYYGPNGLYIHPLDLIKVGDMIMNKGIYKNKVIMDEKIVNLMVKNIVPYEKIKHDKSFKFLKSSYSNLIWRRNENIFMLGHFGQYLVINRRKKLVVCRLVNEDSKNFFEEIVDKGVEFSNFLDIVE